MSFGFGLGFPKARQLAGGPSLNFQFAGSTTLDPLITFTRASTATFFNSSGVLTTAAINAPRFDYNPATLAARGLLIEEQRTNSIRNNTMQGAVAGTPGTLPQVSGSPSWQQNSGAVAVNVIGTGTENGITYIDLQFVGTPDQTFANIRFDPNTQIVAANGQTWTSSFFVRRVAGTTTNITDIDNRIYFRDAGGIGIQEAGVSVLSLLSNSSINNSRTINSLTAANASIVRINNGINLGLTIGQAIDITLRIGLPQLEQGAFATSVIPTTTIAVTRSADVASVNTLSPWYNASESTLYFEFTPVGMKSLGTALASIDNGATATERIALLAATNNGMQNVTTVGGATSGNSTTPSTIYAANTTYKVAMAVKLNDIQSFANGVAGTAGTTALMPSGLTALQFNRTFASPSSINNQWIRRFTYYPRRLSQAEGIAITA